VLDCFMEIPLPEGHSQIMVTYIPAGLASGLAVSVTTVLLILFSWLFRKKQFLIKVKNLWYRWAPPMLRLAFTAVILTVYLLPVLIWLTQFI